MKLCKDCKYSHKDITFLKCKRPKDISPVYGDIEPVNTYCSTERVTGWFMARIFNDCGKEGRYFEEKV